LANLSVSKDAEQTADTLAEDNNGDKGGQSDEDKTTSAQHDEDGLLPSSPEPNDRVEVSKRGDTGMSRNWVNEAREKMEAKAKTLAKQGKGSAKEGKDWEERRMGGTVRNKDHSQLKLRTRTDTSKVSKSPNCKWSTYSKSFHHLWHCFLVAAMMPTTPPVIALCAQASPEPEHS
jgi:hypothetical protein